MCQRSTHWVLSSSSAATAETKGTKRLLWSSSRTIGRTTSYRSLQMSPRMCAADAEMGWRRVRKKKWKEKRQQYRSLHRLSVEFSHQDLLRLKASVSPSHLGIWAAGCRVACSRQMAALCLLCRSASNARILNHQTWICCRSLLAEGDTLWVTIRETTHYCAVTNESSSEHMEPGTYHITKTETR